METVVEHVEETQWSRIFYADRLNDIADDIECISNILYGVGENTEGEGVVDLYGQLAFLSRCLKNIKDILDKVILDLNNTNSIIK